MKHTDSTEAAVKHILHCAMAASSAIERGDSVHRVKAYLSDIARWAALVQGELDEPVSAEVRDIAERLRPRVKD